MQVAHRFKGPQTVVNRLKMAPTAYTYLEGPPGSVPGERRFRPVGRTTSSAEQFPSPFLSIRHVSPVTAFAMAVVVGPISSPRQKPTLVCYLRRASLHTLDNTSTQASKEYTKPHQMECRLALQIHSEGEALLP